VGPEGGAKAWSAVAVGVPTALVAWHASFYGSWIVDDAGITFAYARSVSTGAGPVLQPGAGAVEGFSNPAWLALLVVGRWLHLFDKGTWFGTPDLVTYPKTLALLCCLGIFVGFLSIARTISSRPILVTLAAGSITAAIPSFVIWTTSGLENPLLALAVVTIAAVLVRACVEERLLETRTAVLCGALAALAGLTRPDGAIYLAAYPVALLVAGNSIASKPTRRALGTSVLVGAVPLLVYLVWRLATFGTWLPNTAIAKEQDLPVLSDLDKPGELVTYLGWLGFLLTAVLVVLAIQRGGKTATGLRMLLIPLALALVAYAVLNTDWMTQHRFATPVWPLAALAFTASLAEVFRTLTPPARVVTCGAVALVATLTLSGWRQAAKDFRITPTVSVCYVARSTGYTFNIYAERLGIDDGSLLAVDGGGTSLTSRLEFVDLSGLGDHDIAEYWHHDDMAGLRDHVFEDVRPTFIRIWDGWDGVPRLRLLEDERLARDYVQVWGPPTGGGNWVRRDAVEDEAALVALQEEAPGLAAAVDAPYVPGDMRWWCGRTLRPPTAGSDPTAGVPALD
jgi:hypothetical protein